MPGTSCSPTAEPPSAAIMLVAPESQFRSQTALEHLPPTDPRVLVLHRQPNGRIRDLEQAVGSSPIGGQRVAVRRIGPFRPGN